jgi:ATP-dependent DNA helicase DinG
MSTEADKTAEAMIRWSAAKAAMGWPNREEQDYGFAHAAAHMAFHGDAYLQAGCGVGKTGAMFWAPEFTVHRPLDPAHPEEASTARVIVSAFTKAQGAQNMLTAQRGVDAGLFKAAVELRGRSEYICLRRWVEATGEDLLLPEDSPGLRADAEAAAGYRFDAGLWASVRSNSDKGCSVRKCGDVDYANRARARACAPGIVVCTNHTVIALDVAFRGVLFGLNDTDVLLLDEGHQVADAFRSALGASITTRRFHDLEQAYRDATMEDTNTKGATAMDRLFAAHATGKGSDTVDLNPSVMPYLDVAMKWTEHVEILSESIEEDEDRKAIAWAAERLGDDLSRAFATLEGAEGDVAWVEWDRSDGPRRLNVMPLDVADFVREVIDTPAATMVMSATLSGQPLKDLGVPASRLIDAGTPFDLASKRLGLVASYSAKGNEEQRIQDMVKIVRKVVSEGGGVIVVSKTSSRQIGGRWVSQMEEAQAALERAGFSVGIQNDTSDIPRLVAELTEGTIDVIIGKRAVGEGINVEGPRLSAVIFLDRPWPYMGDPVLKARARRSGDKWGLPSALMKVNLEQGIGRLIRTVDDEGIVVMLDGSATRDFAEAMHPSKVVRLGAR